jgi:thiamine biosynthesis lipoprotein
MIHRHGRAMGSPVRLQVDDAAAGRRVDAAWGVVTAEFEAVEQALSRFRETSEIHRARLAGGRSDRPSRRLLAALTSADRARRVTDGRFEPRVLRDLERLGSVPIPIPVLAESGTGRRRTQDRLLVRSGRCGPIRIPEPVDFGGIGKGLALRWAARQAERVLAGAPFLLEAGGDIVVRGTAGDDGWRIAIEDPRGGSIPAVVLEPPRDGAVATSSVRLGRWQAGDGSSVHHLIDPRTGEPGGTGLLAVTVAGSDPAWAEVWSKALFIEGSAGIARLARGRGLAAWWIGADGTLEMTALARTRTRWLAREVAA